MCAAYSFPNFNQLIVLFQTGISYETGFWAVVNFSAYYSEPGSRALETNYGVVEDRCPV
jgi:hypothetical protein